MCSFILLGEMKTKVAAPPSRCDSQFHSSLGLKQTNQKQAETGILGAPEQKAKIGRASSSETGPGGTYRDPCI